MGRPPSIARPIGILLVALLALGVAGCDLMVAQVTPQPSRLSRTPEPLPSIEDDPGEVPTPRPEHSGDGPDLVDAADGLADLDSYRVSVSSTGLVPATVPNGRVTMTSTLVQGDSPAAEFTMVGVDGLEGGRLQAVVIGDQAWTKEGAGRWTVSPGGAADFDAAFTTLSPIGLASGFEALSATFTPAGSGTKNGIRSVHYRAQAGADTEDLGLSSGTADLWIATSGNFLVSLDLDGTWDVDGAPTPVTLKIEVTRVNDRSNTVKPPV
ncbi:MAG TPA: hypothetical protein VH440_03235 [Candidatus Limnocylindrales bacterium]